MPSNTKKKVAPTNALHPGAVRPIHISKNSQAHPGVSPLSAVGHRNTSFQPLPRPLGLPPYHYSLADNFPAIAANLDAAKKMVLHVLGDSGGVKDGEFQNNVAQQMIKQAAPGAASVPQVFYHVGDGVHFTGMNDDYYAQFYDRY